tara:strand:+ start:440 stop:1093 length:654 start_codon:yes stop_codon:yes gene_type:complete
MKKNERVTLIMKRLEDLYPHPQVPLNHINEFTLLVAVMLSAQSKDEKVNELTLDLFNLASNPTDMVQLGEECIYMHIKKLGLAGQKAKNIFKTSKIILNEFKSEVPRNFIDLESLPGVGHKTASVVLAQAFGIETFPIDTHIHRLAQRWGLTSGISVKQTEIDLKTLFPKNKWNKLHLQIIFYGREFCSSRSCDGTKCRLCKELYPNRTKAIIHLKP